MTHCEQYDHTEENDVIKLTNVNCFLLFYFTNTLSEGYSVIRTNKIITSSLAFRSYSLRLS